MADLRDALMDYGFRVSVFSEAGFHDVKLVAPRDGTLNPDEADALGAWLSEAADEVRKARCFGVALGGEG